MNPRILICISCHNRKRIAELCLPTMRDAMHADDKLGLYQDGSTEYDDQWLMQFCPSNGFVSYIAGSPFGIQWMRREHLSAFLDATQRTHLYLTDHDMIHDPSWRENALRLQAAHGQRPLCLYNTRAHSEMPGNTMTDDAHSDVIWRRFAPGCSYLLTREHVERLRPSIATMDHFDWTIPALIGPFATSRVSYCDHIGWGGVHHPEKDGFDGGDRATSPTDWLVAKRAEIVAKLKEGA